MATKKENIKKLFSDTRSRNVVIITGFLLVIMIVVGLIALRDRIGGAGVTGTTKVSGRGAARVRSIPGALKPSEEYVKLVQKANIEAAEKAKKSGRSAIPTIVKAQELTEGNIPTMPQGAVGGVPFSSLARGGTPTRGIWFNNLVRTNCSPEALAEAKAAGAAISDLKAAGCTARKLVDGGYTLTQLKEGGCPASDLRAAGFTAAQLRAAGFSAADLRNAGYSACEVKAAGYSAEEMRAAGYSDGELRGAGFSAGDIAGSTGLPPGMTEDDLIKLSCEKDGVLTARKQGVTAKKIRSLLGTPANRLSGAGYSWDDLHKAGFSALELSKAGADCSQLKESGYTVQQLVETGICTADKLTGIGVSPSEIDSAINAVSLPGGLTIDSLSKVGCASDAVGKLKTAGLSAGQIRRTVGCNADVLRSQGYSPRQLRNAGYTARELADAGVSTTDLKASGYTDGQAKAASLLPGCITIEELQKAGCDPESLSNLRRRGVSAAHIKQYVGCSAEALLRSGFSANDLKSAGFTASELAKAGQSCSQLRQAGASAKELLESGICTESELLAAGFSAEEIAAAKDAKLSGGYTAAQLRAVGCLPSALGQARSAGVKVNDLRRLGGFHPSTLRNAGYSAQEMKAVGYTPREIVKAGYSESELRGAGLSVDDIKISQNLPGGMTVRDIREGCCSVDSIAKARKAGVDAHMVRDIAGCSARALRNGGYGAEDLLDAGFTPRELQSTGIDCGQLARGGACAAALLESKVCMANDLLDHGYTAVQISAAQNAIKLPGDYSINKLNQTGCIVDSLRDGRKAGLSAGQYRRILGCGATTLRLAGYPVADLQRAGFSARESMNGGFGESDLLRAGYSQMQIDTAGDIACVACSAHSGLKAGGCTKLALEDARTSGISAGDIKDIINCSAGDLSRAGYGPNDLRNAGFVAKELKQAGISCDQLKESGVSATELLNGGACTTTELQAAGFDAKQIERAENGKLSGGYDYQTLVDNGCKTLGVKSARNNGVSAGEIRRVLGCEAKSLKDAGFSGGELKQSGYSAYQLKGAGYSAKDLRIAGFSAKTLRNACFSVAELKKAGFSASDLAKAGFSAKELMAAGFSAEELKQAGFSAKELLDAGFSVKDLADAGYSTKELMDAGISAKDLAKAGISPDALNAEALKAAGVTAADMLKAGYSCAQLKDMGYNAGDLKQTSCSIEDLKVAGLSVKDLKDGGFTAKELKDGGCPAKDLLKAFSAKELMEAGFSAKELLAAGVTPRELLNAGFSVKDLRDAGLSASDLRKAGLTAAELLQGGFSEDEIRKAGYTTAQLGDAGILPVTGLPGQGGGDTAAERANRQLEEVYRRQTAQLDAQKFQQQIQKRLTKMQGEAVKSIAAWKSPVTQSYNAGNPPPEDKDKDNDKGGASGSGGTTPDIKDEMGNVIHRVKAGDIIYAVLDTTINSDESAPILATITHGPLKGGKLIGTMTKPPNAKSVLVTFNTLSLKQLDHSIPLTAYAIDQNTARTALASRVDNHFLLKYGSIIATSFLDGFGQAFLQQGTSISTAGGGATTTVTVGSRKASEAALIGLGKLGQKLGQAVTPLQNKPPTVYVYSGTPVGVFFTADMEIK